MSAQAVPSDAADIAVTPLESPETSTGVVLGVLVPLPSCPKKLLPQHLTAPVPLSAQLKEDPAATATYPLASPTTSTAEPFPTVVPSPNCPLAFAPQHFTPPTAVTAQEWR